MRKRKSWLQWLDISPGGITPEVNIDDTYIMYEARQSDKIYHRKLAIFAVALLPVLIPVIPLAAAILVIAVVGVIILLPSLLLLWFLFLRKKEGYTRPWRPRE